MTLASKAKADYNRTTRATSGDNTVSYAVEGVAYDVEGIPHVQR